MPIKSDNKIFAGFVLTLITGVIGYSIQHYYGLQAKQAELWNESKLKAYTEFIESNGMSDAARFRLGLLGSREVILSAGKYEKSLRMQSDGETRHKAAIDLFQAMRKDVTPWKSGLSAEQNENLEWVMTPNYMQKKLQDESKTK